VGKSDVLATGLPGTGDHRFDVRPAGAEVVGTLLVRWEPLDDQRALTCVDAHGWTHRVTLTVAESGRLERVDIARWGNPEGKKFREHIFTALLDGPEGSFDEFTIPTSCRAGWWHCPDHCADQEFIRFTLDHATYQ
jgi:hypothetical protein